MSLRFPIPASGKHPERLLIDFSALEFKDFVRATKEVPGKPFPYVAAPSYFYRDRFFPVPYQHIKNGNLHAMTRNLLLAGLVGTENAEAVDCQVQGAFRRAIKLGVAQGAEEEQRRCRDIVERAFGEFWLTRWCGRGFLERIKIRMVRD